MGSDTLKNISKLHFTGAASEALVASYLLSSGCEVFLPMITQSMSDLIYLKPFTNELVRVQVKTGTKSVAGINKYSYEQVRLINRGGLSKSSKPYTVDDIDELWVVGTHLWCFPSSVIDGKTSLYLGTDNKMPKTMRRTYNPDDYVIVRGEWDVPYRERVKI